VMMRAPKPAILASWLGHRRDNASPKDDWDMRGTLRLDDGIAKGDGVPVHGP
jgi:hypothetical protein